MNIKNSKNSSKNTIHRATATKSLGSNAAAGKNGKTNRKMLGHGEKGSGMEKSIRQSQFLYQCNIIFLCTVTLLALAAAGFAFHQAGQATREKQELADELDLLKGSTKTLYTRSEVEKKEKTARAEGEEDARKDLLMQIQSAMESGGSTASMLRGLFSDDIVVVSGGKYYFYPILKGVERNSFQSEDFSLTDDGRLQYSGENKIHLQSGIDVSEKNGDINWSLVAEDDVAFAMICGGGRTASERNGEEAVIKEDERLEDNIAGAAEAGLHVGVYYVLGETTEDEAKAAAEKLASRLESCQDKIDYPVAVWVNMPQEDENAGVGKSTWTDCVAAFCDTIEAAGYEPLIYGNLASFVMNLNIDTLEGYGKWIANTGAGLYFPYRFSMWQYSTTGTVQGIANEVGLDVSLAEG